MTPPVTMQISEIEKGFGRGTRRPGAPGATPWVQAPLPGPLSGQVKGGVAQRPWDIAESG